MLPVRAAAGTQLFAGFILCAAPDVMGGRGGDVKGLRGVTFLGVLDPNYSLAPEARKVVEKYAPNAKKPLIRRGAQQLHVSDGVYWNGSFRNIINWKFMR